MVVGLAEESGRLTSLCIYEGNACTYRTLMSMSLTDAPAEPALLSRARRSSSHANMSYTRLHASSSPSTTLARTIRTSSTGLSSPSVLTIPMRCTTFIPLRTLPKIVCFPSNHGVGANVTKN